MSVNIEPTQTTLDSSSSTPEQPRHHEHHQPPAPVPNTRHRSSFNFSLPTPALVGSIAEGAHYAGGPQPHSGQVEVHDSESHIKHRRPEQLGPDDPAVEQVYRAVIDDLEEVCKYSYILIKLLLDLNACYSCRYIVDG